MYVEASKGNSTIYRTPFSPGTAQFSSPDMVNYADPGNMLISGAQSVVFYLFLVVFFHVSDVNTKSWCDQ